MNTPQLGPSPVAAQVTRGKLCPMCSVTETQREEWPVAEWKEEGGGGRGEGEGGWVEWGEGRVEGGGWLGGGDVWGNVLYL